MNWDLEFEGNFGGNGAGVANGEKSKEKKRGTNSKGEPQLP